MLKVQHDCEINLRQDEVLFIPGKGPIRSTLGALRRSCMISSNNPSAKKYLRSRASIVYEKRRHLRHYKYTIHPFSLFRHWWDSVMILSMYGIFFILPYQAAFDMYRKVHGWTLTKNLFIGLYMFDIIVNFRTGFVWVVGVRRFPPNAGSPPYRYYDKSLRMVQLESRLIAAEYVYRGTFVFDLVGSLPTDLFFLTNWNTLIVLRELTSLLMVFRGLSIYSYTKRLANSYDISVDVMNIMIFAAVSVLIFHWQACIHYVVPLAVVSMGLPEKPGNRSWISEHEIWDQDAQTKYRFSLFRAVAIFTCSGFDGAPPSSAEDQYLAITFQVVATFIMATIVGALMHIFKGINSSRLKYEAMNTQLMQYMRHKQMPLESQERFMSYFAFRYQNSYFRESEILNTVSAQLSQEIGMHSCRKLVENVTFFNNLPMSLLVRIVALLRSEIFLTNDVIVRANQPGDCMYFIASGTVAIYTKSGKEVCHLEDGAHFGEIALVMPDERRVASVVAVEICELYRLERADFARTIHPYPMLWERIKKIAMERHEKTTILNAQ